jgi:hypothetical protein
MDLKCTNCGALLPSPQFPGASLTCRFCGAPQVFPAPPAPPPASPPRFAQNAPLAVPPRSVGIFLAIAGVVILISFIGALAQRSPGAGGLLGARLDVSALNNVSLEVTPAAMTTTTHVPVGNNEYMMVPLSSCPFKSIAFKWDESDLSHVSYFSLEFANPGQDAAPIRQRLRAALGPHMDASGSYSWGFANASFANGVLSAGVEANDPIEGKNPHRELQLDTLWNLVRSEALGLKVKVDDAAVRDWLGRGRPPSLLASLDPETNVEASASAVRALFPGATLGQVIEVERTVALDHPLLSEAKLSWDNKSLARLKSARFEPPNQAEAAADQPKFEACLQAAYGPATKRTETDHMKAEYTSEWSFDGDSGEVEVDEFDVTVRVETLVWSFPGGPKPHRMPRASWQRLIGVLDACGRH